MKNVDNYFLANRTVGLFQLTLTFLATQLGGGLILGTYEAAIQYGPVAIFYAFGLSLGLFALSLGIGAKFRNLSLKTIPEIFSKVYQSTKMQYAASILMIASLFLILVAIGTSFRKLFYLRWSHDWWFVLSWLIITMYTSFGGLKTVIKTDVYQIIYVLIVFVILGCFLGFNAKLDLSAVSQTLNFEMNIPWISWIIMPMFFVILGQDMGQRCMAAKDSSTIIWATLLSGIILLLSTSIPLILGLLQKSNFSPLENNTALNLFNLIYSISNKMMAQMFIVAVAMAIISTADSLLCAISSNVYYDLLPSKFSINHHNHFQ